MEPFAAYGHAIVSLAGTAICGLLLSPVSAMRKSAIGLPPGSQPEADYSSSVYRWHRSHANLSETIGYFVACTLAAMLAGASPFWVNVFASVFFISRLVLAVVHIRGIGRADMGARTFIYVVGWLMCLLLALMAIFSVF